MTQTDPATASVHELIQALSQPEAYPYPVDRVDVIQTHISIVFLAGDRVYKLKKPLDLGFLDYSTLDLRRACCEAEVSLNRRLATEVYLGVESITREPNGELRVSGEGDAVEHAVVMKRLPEEQTFKALLARGELTDDLIERLATVLARFHADAERSAAIAAFGDYPGLAANCRENFEQLRPFVGETIHPTVLARLEQATERELDTHRALIASRAKRHVPCDSHGDLRLEHVYQLPDRSPPSDLVVVDCIEFNERFRYGDPVLDLAFLVMELRKEGRTDLADRLTDRYVGASGDEEGRALLPLYTAYRATVRGKVHGFAVGDEEIPAEERERARDRARGDLLFADALLRPLDERPALVLVGGLPCTGKSSLAGALSKAAGLTWIRSDVVRKELAGLDPTASAADVFEAGIYTPEWSRRTYAECQRQTEAALFEGRRVVVDACFASASKRELFLQAARRWEVPFVFLHCQLDPAEVRRRLDERARGTPDPSDADWDVYQAMLGRWESMPKDLLSAECVVNTSGTHASSLAEAQDALRQLGVL